MKSPVAEHLMLLHERMVAGVVNGALFDNDGELARLIGRPTTLFQTTITGFVRNQQAVGEASGHA
jgi:NAD(P)H dehydrogenase (quinone)